MTRKEALESLLAKVEAARGDVSTSAFSGAGECAIQNFSQIEVDRIQAAFNGSLDAGGKSWAINLFGWR